MAENVPIIIMPSARKSNFAQGHIDLKFLALVFFVMGVAPLVLIFIDNSTSQMLKGIIIQGSGAFYISVAIQCLLMSISDQELKKHLESRLGIIAYLLSTIAFTYWELPHMRNFKPYSDLLHLQGLQFYSIAEYQKISYYRRLYNIGLPALLTLVLLIRTIPMTISFFKLKRQNLLAV